MSFVRILRHGSVGPLVPVGIHLATNLVRRGGLEIAHAERLSLNRSVDKGQTRVGDRLCRAVAGFARNTHHKGTLHSPPVGRICRQPRRDKYALLLP